MVAHASCFCTLHELVQHLEWREGTRDATDPVIPTECTKLVTSQACCAKDSK
ncbi:hypothetical protein F751_0719 [Auxenochlorella protothecoides]|uniref:Uncharacterized protein n=1 Tax=Auxenochlorella protothecoides TaxID=3075 RepID=A0A087SM33_AUXPR|nr:hypothetical protein F751_0719 [Auxenochlorella protothecoides]KFM26787.1 hypothetical protein F751_0719 [Auxenochlorella protothecoides]